VLLFVNAYEILKSSFEVFRAFSLVHDGFQFGFSRPDKLAQKYRFLNNPSLSRLACDARLEFWFCSEIQIISHAYSLGNSQFDNYCFYAEIPISLNTLGIIWQK